jgi:carboxypeptidase family protein
MRFFVSGVLSFLLAAQANQATITGVVRDSETGEPLPGVLVSLPDHERSALSDASGRYILRNVAAGPQHLTVRIIGYTTRTLHALVPRNGILEINVSLRAAPIPLARLEVRTPIAIRAVEHGDTVFPDQALSIAAVRNHPLLAEPDVFQALSGGSVGVDVELPSGIHVRGGAADHTAFLLDGIPVFSPYHVAGTFSAWNPDALSRLHLYTAAPSPDLPDALSGTVGAVTRTPGSRLRTEGSFSTSQARFTVDGPIGGGAGYLLSLRSAFPGVIAPRREASYLRAETGDALAKFEAPLLGGRVRLLGFESENEVGAAAVAEEPDIARPARNTFEWTSRSIGGEWLRSCSCGSLRLLGWRASSHAHALWVGQDAASMSSSRSDQGLLVALQQGTPGANTVLGLRYQESQTTYDSEPLAADRPASLLTARTPVFAAFGRHAHTFGSQLAVDAGVAAAVAAGEVHVSPRTQMRWRVLPALTMSASFARLHQFAQSVRNPESVFSTLFPAELFVGASRRGVPVARSDQVILASDYRPWAGVHIGVQAYSRRFADLLLVAPRTGLPFLRDAFVTGSANARGLSLDAAASSERFGIVANYGWQRVRFAYADSVYIPEHGNAQTLETGVIVFPTSTSSIRAGVSGVWGRRTTLLNGALEWEGCNLLDRGCEFGGSPHYDTTRLGHTALPAYFRVDLGARKHWHLDVAGRDAVVALFGTITNVLGRTNVLNYSSNPDTGEKTPITLRPFAPIVVGMEWRF